MEDLQVLVESSVVRSEHNQYTPGCVHFPSHLDYWMCPVLFLRTYTHYTFIYLASHMPLHLNDSLTRKKTQARMLFLGVVALTVFRGLLIIITIIVILVFLILLLLLICLGYKLYKLVKKDRETSQTDAETGNNDTPEDENK
ncbi:hypothetical protein Y032_0043g828 [Ancylostoma ceylanicum]|uniref:Uncharacterized protein n=1 Tax=Ancylostoma ceylanicum TaxID=53326 RepID=A0A016UER3_9BILA|nr:hypothetical protein Y032_0043g828 [Ancylostoma ceylanicum]